MEEDLTCPVCLELYADPLMMTCSHSICKTCLNDIKVTREKLGKTEFECPTCRESHPIVQDLLDKLPKNLVLENIVIRFQEIKSTSLSQAEGLFDQSPPLRDPKSVESANDESDDVFDESLGDSTCGMCDENQNKKAEWYCPQCDVLYCQSCLNTFHPRKGSLGRHKVCRPMQRRVVKESVLHCREHTSERASIFCDTCKAVACHLCVCQGQGSHGNHVILDLNTAKEKIQTTFSKAAEDLSVLISAFGLKDKEMDSQLDTIKGLHHIAQTQITSQFQCFLSDAAATLHLARRKFQESVRVCSSCHSEPLETRSKQIKSSLGRCLILMDQCNRLMGDETPAGWNKNLAAKTFYFQQQDENRHCRARSLPQPFPSQGSSGTFNASSSEDGPHSLMAEPRRDLRVKPKSRRSLSLLDQKEAKQIPIQDLVNKLSPATKSQEDLLSPDSKSSDDLSNSSSKRKGIGEAVNKSSSNIGIISGGQLDRKMNRSPLSLKNAPDVTAKGACAAMASMDKTDKNSHLKFNENSGNSEKGLKDQPGSDKNTGNADSIKSSVDANISSKNSPEISRQGLKMNSDPSICPGSNEMVTERREMKQDDLMLTQAARIEQILEEIAHLTKELDLVVVGNEEDLLSEVTRNLSSSLSSFNDVAVKLLSYLATDNSSEISDIPIMMPSVRSVASPVSPGQKGLPRVQSRTLITWGFNSTSFTAEPVELRGQWTVNIARNTSHIGDVKTGYLFGVGVARQSLTSKEQVGMNPYSYGIICSNGTIAFCQDSHVTPITLLSDLPLTIRLAVTSGSSCHLGIVLSYWITLPGAMNAIQGRRVIALHSRRNNPMSSSDEDGDCHSPVVCSDDNFSKNPNSDDSNAEGSRLHPDKDNADCKASSSFASSPMLPVFTVSQRVKMTFPVNSEDS